LFQKLKTKSTVGIYGTAKAT